MTVEFVRLKKFCELTGYTEKACRRKIEDGKWLEGKVYRRGPDNRILIHLPGFNKWVEAE